jgi:peptide/nickel transport system permease protein
MRWLRRVLLALFTIWLVATLTFVVVEQAPGDIFYLMAQEIAQARGVSIEVAYAQVRSMVGYDPTRPLLQRYLEWMGELLRGNLGFSYFYRISVNQILFQALPWTVFVLSTALLLSFTIGVLLGLVIAVRRRTWLDPLITGYASLTDATPDYLTALLLLIFLALQLKWFPSKGAYDSSLTPGFNLPFLLSVLHHAALPITAYTLENIGAWALAMKGSAVSVLGEDFIAFARARGLRESRILTHYVGRNAILPMVTGLALAFGGMFGGSVLIETVFHYPGIGWFFKFALDHRDYGMMRGLLILTTVAIVMANLITDLIYPLLDPRIRMED